MALVASGLGLHVSGFDLLSAIDLRIEPGEVTVVVGPNGAGKSSLLRALCGELTTTEGTVSIDDQSLESLSLHNRAEQLAVMSQSSQLNFPFTAAEVVSLGRIPHDSGKQRDEQIVAAALRAVDAHYLVARPYTNMSGGEKQRVQLARALAQIWEPAHAGNRYLLLDEPTSAFDLSHQQMTGRIVREFADQGVGLLLVMHDLNFAAQCADNLVVLNNGRIAAQGAPESILSRELVDEVFQVDCVISRHPINNAPMVIT